MNIRINKIGNAFWYHPPILTMSRRKWMSRPYKKLQKLLKMENLIDQNFTLRMNGDPQNIIFREMQVLLKYDFFLNNDDALMIAQKKFVDYSLPKSTIIFRWDTKGIKNLNMGIIPFYSIDYIKKEFGVKRGKEKTTLLWRKGGWTILKNKML